MKRNLLTILYIIVPFFGFSQELLHCGADELRISTLKQMPVVAKAVISRDEKLEAFTKEFISSSKKDDATYIIPVVFHVIHNYGPENISETQIYDGIDVLNKTFRKMLADTASIVSDFKALHADTKIEFRLAQKDPDGNCHSGINRIASSLTTKGDHSVKTLIHWPPNKYLNIYVVTNAAGLAGHCVWPADADTIPEWDGIVVGHNYVGSIGTADYTRSVALAHECGHYLNLHHIWGGNNVPGFYYLPCGDPNKDCNIDDLVADTPPTIGWQSCNLNASSCGSPRDNVQNVMDYSYCNRMFTYGQRDRMHACLNSSIAGRNNLWSDANLIATGVKDAALLCEADFTADRRVICAGSGNTVQFTNLTFNKDAANTYSWYFSGGTPAVSFDKDPKVSYANPGTYAVQLIAANENDTVSKTKYEYITVLEEESVAFPYSEGFESTTLNETGIYASSLDEKGTWDTCQIGKASSNSIVLRNFGVNEPTVDQLYGLPVDLSGTTDARLLQFDYAYAKLDANDATQVNVYFSGNCNDGWQKRSQLSGTGLSTAPNTGNSFVPADANQWKTKVINIPVSFYYENFRYRIEVITASGNNVYIDNIRIIQTSGLSDLQRIADGLELFPVPVDNELNLNFELGSAQQIELAITSITGSVIRKVAASNFTSGKNSYSLSTSDLSAGMYFVQLSGAFGKVTKPFIIK